MEFTAYENCQYMFPSKPSKVITPLPIPPKTQMHLPDFQNYLPMQVVCHKHDTSTQTNSFLNHMEVNRDQSCITSQNIDSENTRNVKQFTFKDINVEYINSKLLRVIAKKLNTQITQLHFVIALLFLLMILLFVIIIVLRIQV